MYETYCPPEYRGRGVAGILCEAAFEHCREHGVSVVPTCTYISGRFVQKHPEYSALLKEA